MFEKFEFELYKFQEANLSIVLSNLNFLVIFNKQIIT